MKAAPVLKAADPADVRARCPRCGSDVVSNCYHVGGQGYVILWECVGFLAAPEDRTCDYRVEFPVNGAPIVLGQAAEIGSEREQKGG